MQTSSTELIDRQLLNETETKLKFQRGGEFTPPPPPPLPPLHPDLSFSSILFLFRSVLTVFLPVDGDEW